MGYTKKQSLHEYTLGPHRIVVEEEGKRGEEGEEKEGTEGKEEKKKEEGKGGKDGKEKDGTGQEEKKGIQDQEEPGEQEDAKMDDQSSRLKSVFDKSQAQEAKLNRLQIKFQQLTQCSVDDL